MLATGTGRVPDLGRAWSEGRRIGVLGPVALADFDDLLPGQDLAGDRLPGLGGPPVHWHVRELLRRGRRVTLFTLDPTIDGERVFEGDRLKICVGPYTRHRGRAFFRREIGYLRDALRREQPDILSAHWTYEFAAAAIASGIPHVVTAHDAPWRILRHNPSPYRLVRTAMAYMVGRTARRLVAVSPYVADHLRRFGFRTGAIDVIPNALPPILTGKQSARRTSGTEPVFAGIFSGGWDGLKNGATLIDAFAMVRRHLPGARLLLVGAECGPAGPAAAWASARGLDVGVRFVGRLPHPRVLDWLGTEIDVLVHVSREEAFGLTLIEAAACGVPVIAGRDSGAVPWILGDGAYGQLVDVGSASAVARAMMDLAENEARRSALAAAARRAATERFDIVAVTDRYEDIFASLSRQT